MNNTLGPRELILPDQQVMGLTSQMTDEQASRWAALSAEKTADTQVPGDLEGVAAAKAYLAHPTPEAKAAAASAAQKGMYASPGALAAGAIGLSNPAAGAPTMTKALAASSVNMAASRSHQLQEAKALADKGKSAAGQAAKAQELSRDPAAAGLSQAKAAAIQKIPPTPGLPTASPSVPGSPPSPALGAPEIPPPPGAKELAALQKSYDPFLELGRAILAGKV